MENLEKLEEDIFNLPYSLERCSNNLQACYKAFYQEILDNKINFPVTKFQKVPKAG